MKREKSSTAKRCNMETELNMKEEVENIAEDISIKMEKELMKFPVHFLYGKHKDSIINISEMHTNYSVFINFHVDAVAFPVFTHIFKRMGYKFTSSSSYFGEVKEFEFCITMQTYRLFKEAFNV